MDFQRAALFDGWLSYHPGRGELTNDQQEGLTELLIEKEVIEDTENPAVVLTWLLNQADGPPYHHREQCTLYRDGGDWEDPGFVFIRWNAEGYRVHIPEEDIQYGLGEESNRLWMWWEEYFFPSLRWINDYLDSIVNQPGAWLKFTFAQPAMLHEE
ncbi:MAG TPA: hypothetical protein VJ742_13455 [Nitrososphaera sp.]|nr:hypothetical protein [Nitrososphaera sp.]